MLSNFELDEFVVVPLTTELVEKYADDICRSLDQIPLVEPHTIEQLLAEGNEVIYN